MPEGPPLVTPFPQPGRGLRQAYRELEMAEHGTDDQRTELGDPADLPRPWLPETLTRAQRRELWDWLDAVVLWLNEHYTWESGAMIPSCWDRHPHLVLELATVADLRHRAGRALTGDAMEDWHRYCIPAFAERMRNRIRTSCDDRHSTWPGRTRKGRFDDEREARARRLRCDVEHWSGQDRTGADPRQDAAPPSFLDDPTLDLGDLRVDPDTGEVID